MRVRVNLKINAVIAHCNVYTCSFDVYQAAVNSGDKQYGFVLIHCLTAVHNAVGRNGKILGLNKEGLRDVCA